MGASERYFDERGRPQYAKSVLLFADTLGTSLRAPSRNALLDAYDSIESHLLLSEYEVGWEQGTTSSFSDSVIYSEPLLEPASEQILRLIKRSALYQLANTLNTKGPLRGAITIGDFFHDAQLAYGPALVEAADIEKSIAASPRVVLSRNVVQELHGTKSNYEGFVWFDPINSIYFIGYLAISNYVPIMHASSPAQALNVHKLVIENALRNGAPLDKFSWLANYHNNYVRRALPERTDLEIEPSDKETPEWKAQLIPIEELR